MPKKPKLELPKFRPLTTEEQRKLYPRYLRRARNVSAQRLYREHSADLGKADRLEEQLKEIPGKIAKIEDAVANRADRHFGTWKWRQSQKTVREVVSWMHHATRKLREKQEDLETQIKRLRQPFIDEKKKLEELTDKLLREAGCDT